jgi:RimJ/RimL family protein N-acetyltransferase
MQLSEFIETHVPALEQDEVRHNLILGVLARYAKAAPDQLMTWTLGQPGACAIKTPGRPIILGDLTREQCHAFAEATHDLAYEGVVGIEHRPAWFVERAVELGLTFAGPVPQRIHALRRQPMFPRAAGSARPVTVADGALLANWVLAFQREAVPEDPVPQRGDLEKVAGEGRHMFWVVAGQPVSVAGIARRLRSVTAIAPVYTPPEQRGRGYAGSVTAALAERLFAEGNSAVCLYTDLRNAASNRCYARIGFTGVCDASVYLRR